MWSTVASIILHTNQTYGVVAIISISPAFDDVRCYLEPDLKECGA